MVFLKSKIYRYFLIFISIIIGGFLIWYVVSNDSQGITSSTTSISPVVEFTRDVEILPQKGDVFGVESDTSFLFKTKLDVALADVQEHLKITPEISFDVKSNGKEKEFEILPKENLEDGEIYKLSFPAENKDLSWAFEVKSSFKAVSFTPRNEATYVPLNAGIEITFNRQGFKNPEQFFEITPEVKGTFQQKGETLIFIPSQKLEESSVYQVKIKKGLPLNDGDDILVEDFEFAFETKEEEKAGPSFSFNSDFVEIYPEDEPILKVFWKKFEIEKQTFNLYRFSTIEEFLESYSDTHKDSSFWAKFQEIDFKPDINKKILSFEPEVINKDKGIIILPQALEEGYYLLETEVNNLKKFCWIQSSPISNYFSKTDQNSFVWTFDFVKREPIQNAKTGFFNEEGEFLTNEKGFVEFKTPEFLVDDNKLNFLIIEKEGYLKKAALIPKERYWWGGNNDLYFDYLNTDRSLYRTDDTVYFWGAVKGRDESLIQKKLKIQFSSSSLSEEPLFEKEVVVSNYGTISGDFSFQDLSPGFYLLNLYYGEKLVVHTYFEIGIFSKPLYQITVNPEKRNVFLGEEAKFKVKSEFFDGTPLASGKFKYKTYFKNGESEGEIELDENGEGEITVKPEYVGSSTADTYWPSSFNITIHPSLFGEGETEARAQINVFGPRMEIRTTNEYDENKVKITAKLNKVEIKEEKEEGYGGGYSSIGDLVKNYPLNLEIKEIIYNKVKTGQIYDYVEKVFHNTYRYEKEENVIETLSGKTDQNGEWIVERELDPEKNYKFTFSGTDQDNNAFEREDFVKISVCHYILETGFSSQQYGFTKTGIKIRNIYLRTTRENEEREDDYILGEKIPLIIERYDDEDFSENENFLFFGYQSKIEETMLSSNPETSFVFEEKYIPNIQFKAVWFSDVGFVESNSLNFPFDISQKELQIEISTDKEKYRPGEDVSLEIKTKKDGVLKSSEARIAIIDEALLAMSPDYYKSDIYNFYDNVYTHPLSVFSKYLVLEDSPGAEGGGCFGKETRILMENGKEKNIEDMKAGDVVLTKKLESLPELASAVVQHTSSHLVESYLLINNDIKITPEHKIFLNGKWQMAIMAREGDFVLSSDNKKVEIEKIEVRKEPVEVYNIIIGNYHTFFANGIFVHNEGKGGETREDFPDMAFYKVLEIKNGFSQMDFELPDNLTSWRIIVEAISKDLDVGKKTENINVSLPFFVNLTLNENYFLDDKPKVVAEAFGKEYKKEGSVSFTLSLPEADFEETVLSEDGTAVFTLPQIAKENEYEIKLEGKWQDFSDAVLRKINFQKTPLFKTELQTYKLSEGLTQIEGNKKGITNVVFIDTVKGRVYSTLAENLWHFGERVEKKISPFIASQILEDFFEREKNIDEPNLSNYMVDNGIALLPWGDDDLLTSAMIANLSPEIFLKYGSSAYFAGILENEEKSNLDKSIALWGLASLGEPALNKINIFENYNLLVLEEEIYLALARVSLGDYETVRETYFTKIKTDIKSKSDFLYLNTANEDKRIKLTGLTAALCSVIDEKDNIGLSEYLFKNNPKKDLKILESLIYAKSFLENYSLPEYIASFDYEIGDKKGSVNLEKGKSFGLNLLPQELLNLQFSNVRGEIEVQSWFQESMAAEDLQKSDDISISKKFLLNDTETTKFKRGDLVLIRLNPDFQTEALGGNYTITDWVPSGLKPVFQSFEREQWEESAYCHPIWHPTFFEGNKVSFLWRKESDKTDNCLDRDISYYARVVTPGAYKVFPAVLQASKNPDIITTSDEYIIEIE